MPRGRPRKGLSRMDAALDAMLKFGFDKELIIKHVKELLGVYGGNGWAFIEDCSYKELLDAILREQENGNLDNVDQIEDKSGGDEELVGPSKIAAETEQEPQDNAPIEPIDSTTTVINNAAGSGWKDIHPNQTNDQESPAPAPAPKTRSCLHFYGWIDRYGEDDDDDLDFITLRPSSMVVGPPKTNMSRKKRRSRWDVKPDDP